MLIILNSSQAQKRFTSIQFGQAFIWILEKPRQTETDKMTIVQQSVGFKCINSNKYDLILRFTGWIQEAKHWLKITYNNSFRWFAFICEC